MKARKLSIIALLICLALLAGCSAQATSSDTAAVANEMAYDYAMAETMAASAGSSGSVSDALPENRKWVVTMNITAETEDLDAALTAVSDTVTELEGYTQDQTTYNGSTYSSRRYRYADLTLRIPADSADSFVSTLSGSTNVVSSSRSAEDITLTYVDTETRVTALETERDRLLELMEKAETVSDLLEIESQLSEVNYELESYSSQLRTLDNQVDYATIYLTIEEVTQYTPVEEQTIWQRIGSGFVESVKSLGQGIVNAAAWVVIKLPYLALAALGIWGAAGLIRRAVRKRRAKKAQKQEGTDENDKH